MEGESKGEGRRVNVKMMSKGEEVEIAEERKRKKGGREVVKKREKVKKKMERVTQGGK